MTLYELRTTDGVDDHWVADVNIDFRRGVAETYDGIRFARTVSFNDVDDVIRWACAVHNADVYTSFLYDPAADSDYIVDCGVFVAA